MLIGDPLSFLSPEIAIEPQVQTPGLKNANKAE